MMRRCPSGLLGALALVVVPVARVSAQGVPPAAEAAFARARTLVTEGNGAAGRTLVDSIVQASPVGTPVWVEGLWWRAVLAEQAATAERDLLRLAIEHPASPRAPEALLRLGQLELARGAREAAARHFEKLVTEHPDSPLVVQAYAGKGRALVDGPRAAEGCAAIAAARSRLTPAQVELRNQLEFTAQRCVGVDVPPARSASPPSAVAPPALAAPAAPTTPPQTPTATPTPARSASAPPTQAAASGPRYTVAAGTFATRAAATAQLRAVERAGFDGRVGLAGPGKHRVFVGERLSRAEAQALQQRLVKAKVKGVTLLAVEP
ncbi:MAG: SPOR domain-containing protein [Gemmatimonadaceae bacterium]|nr:SPOR domain-containing protein [Gemmatimonadaceae bacterium]